MRPVLVVALLVASGCRHDPPIVGSWVDEGGTIQTFQADGTYIETPPHDNGSGRTNSGTYEFSDKLRIRVTDTNGLVVKPPERVLIVRIAGDRMDVSSIYYPDRFTTWMRTSFRPEEN
ncbi:MAG TPA: hypothetical protein VKT78_14055 [Fimbriimonadaceae bacterium]|nr:hypothetical protein [Fimbriimonadaceae bacterium]